MINFVVYALIFRQMVKDDKGMLTFIKSGMYGVGEWKGILRFFLHSHGHISIS